MRSYIMLAMVLGSLTLSQPLWAAAGGGWSFGGNLGFINSDQDDINTLISRANSREGGISTSQLGNAYELSAYIAYRFSGSFVEFQLRPSYFFQSEDGTGGGNDYEYGVDAFTVFPTFRFYMLEDTMMAFYSQVGIGWGFATGEITEGSASVDFSGHDMGYMASLGAMFCLFGANHCITVEGSYRFLYVERLEASSPSGSFAAAPNASLSQYGDGQELELDNEDVSVSLSGILGSIGYVFRF